MENAEILRTIVQEFPYALYGSVLSSARTRPFRFSSSTAPTVASSPSLTVRGRSGVTCSRPMLNGVPSGIS